MPSERGNEKALWKWANHLHRAFLLLLHIFCVRRKCSRRRRKASRRAWWLLHCKPSGRTVLCEAGIPMRKSGEKPYLEGIASAPSTGPHGINGGSGNRAALQTAARPFLILLKKVRKGPPNKAKPACYITPAFAWTLFASLMGCFQSGAVPVLLQKWPPHPRWRSARRSGGSACRFARRPAFLRKAAVFAPRRFPLFVFVLGSPRFVSWPISDARRAAFFGASRERG